MSVNPGDAVNAAVTNAAYISRTTDSSTIGIVSLNNATSGPSVSNLQQKLNDALVRESFATQDIVSTGFININASTVQYRRVQGDGAPVTTSNQPFGTTPADFVQGKMIELVGINDTDTVTIPYSDTQYGCLLKVGDCTLGKGDILVLIYDDTLERFLEVSRNF